MSLTIEPCSRETAVVQVGAALDVRTAAAFKQACQTQFSEGVHNFILDFSRTKHLDSTGLGAIFLLYRQVAPLNGQICLVGISGQAAIVTQMMRLEKIFGLFPTMEAAREALV